MSTATTHARPHAPHPANEDGEAACAACAARSARAAEREAMLRELAETGMAFNAALKRALEALEAAGGKAEDEGPTLTDLSLAYNRVAHGVRQTLALEIKLEQLAEARLAAEGGDFDFAAEADRVRAKVFAMRPDDDPEEREAAQAAGEDHPSHEQFRWAQDFDLTLPFEEDGPLGVRGPIYKGALRDAANTSVKAYVEAVRRIWLDLDGDPATGPP